MASDITVTSLTAVGGLGSITASAMASSPVGMACLPYMQPKSIDFYMATTNNFGSASLVGTVNAAVAVLAIGGVPDGVTRYLWAIAKDSDGNQSARYPAGGGVSVTTKTATPGPNSITEEMIQDGALTKQKFVTGITPVEIVSSLPATGNYAGRMVFLTTNGKLYRHTGSPSGSAGFTAAVPSTDISGTITGTQIANNAISTPHLAANSVTSNAMAANSVTTNALVAGAVSAAKMSVSELSAITANLGEVNAGTITGVTITGGTIRTKSSGERIELNGALNRLTIYSSFGTTASIGGYDGITPQFLVYSGAAYYANTNVFLPALEIKNSGGMAGSLVSSGTDASAHALRASQSRSGGGRGLVGVTPQGGGYGLYAEVGGIGPFTGVHDALFPIGEQVGIGEIVISIGKVWAKEGVDDALLEVAVSTEEKQRGAYGVVSRAVPFDPYSSAAALPPILPDEPLTPLREFLSENFQRLAVNGCGEGLILVCGRGGDISVGDYICTSSMRGKGQRQNDESGTADDLLRRHTVAQATEAIEFDDPDEVKLTSCVYKCA